MDNSTPINWPRVSNLPKEEQEPFSKWLRGQTRPYILDLPVSDQDGYYPWDYKRWKAKSPIID
jgi:hypothetical protein